jgi:uncharacterized membrane protein HdeD (DUF308 family)
VTTAKEKKIMTTFSDLFLASLEQVRKFWGWLLMLGILLAALGITCIVKSQTATHFSIMALGWILAISAVFWLVSAFYTISWQGFFFYLLNAILRGVIGYLLISHPDAGATVTGLVACLLIVGGLYRAVLATLMQFPRWAWTVFAGLVAFILGIYILATWSTVTPYFLGLAIGIDLLLDGTALAGFAGAIHGSLPKVQQIKTA